MANCNEHFQEFNGVIRLTDARRKSLKKSRKELRNKVRKFFKENKKDEIQPKFNGQGSLDYDVIINPIPRYVIEDNEKKTILYYDVDDGIYFIGSDAVKDRHTPETYHNWVYDAVRGHTDKDPIDKDTCIRTLFADGHNIDQPIYYQMGSTPELAHKKLGYILSDPKEFSTWFIEIADSDPQIRRLVRYLKAWSDKKDFDSPSKAMPCGLILTILVAENYTTRDKRDDIALKETLINIQSKLTSSFECNRPTTPSGENLLEGYKEKDYFLKCLSEFIDDAKTALQEKNFRKSSELWRKHLSDRFPLGEDKDDTSSATAGLASLIPSTTKPYTSK